MIDQAGFKLRQILAEVAVLPPDLFVRINQRVKGFTVTSLHLSKEQSLRFKRSHGLFSFAWKLPHLKYQALAQVPQLAEAQIFKNCFSSLSSVHSKLYGVLRVVRVDVVTLGLFQVSPRILSCIFGA